MYSLITILIIAACIFLMLVVLIQNPKGGGLSSSFGGLSNQILGVKRTTDFLEKATWTLIIAVALLSLSTNFFITKTTTTTGPKSELENVDLGGQSNPNLPPPQAPAETAPDTSSPAK